MMEAAARPRVPRWVMASTALLLTGYVAVDAARNVPSRLGLDFYRVWGIPVAHDVLGEKANPYTATERYARVLDEISAHSANTALRRANELTPNLAPTGTPFFYASFAFLPRAFEPANALFAALQYLAAGFAVILLARLRGVGLAPAICIAAMVELTFNPFLQDVKFGNVNSFQLLAIVGFIHLSRREAYLRGAWFDSLCLGLLAVFLAFKPSTLFIAASLAVHFWVVRGPRRFLLGALLALPLAVAAFAWGTWYFQDAYVWRDWLRYTQGMNGGTLLFVMESGNSSFPMLLESVAPSHGVYGYSLILAAILAVMVALAMTSRGKQTALLKPMALALFADPWFAASVGVVFTFATSPLIWPHYHVLVLIPIAWLFRNGAPAATACAVLAYAALAAPVIGLLLAGQQYLLLRALLIFSWLPLVPGLLSQVAARQRRIAAHAAAAE